MSAVYSKNPDIVFRKIADEFVLIPICRNVADMDRIFSLNETAGFIWELIDGKRSLEDLARYVAEEFEVDTKQAGDDLRIFLDAMKSCGNIKEA